MSNDMLIGIFDPEVVEYAVKHEFGALGRDFFRVAIDSNLKNITAKVEEEYRGVIMQKQTPDQAQKKVGEYIVSLIRQMIQDKGLVDTGRLLNSVEVRDA